MSLISISVVAATIVLLAAYVINGNRAAAGFTRDVEAGQAALPEIIPPPAMSADVRQEEIADILALYRQHNEAWCKGNGALYASGFADDADFVAFDGSRTEGRESIRASHQQLFDTFLKNTCLRGYVKRIRFLGADAAVIITVSGTRFGDDKRIRRPSIQTFTASRMDGIWKFTSFHNGRIDPIENWNLLRKIWLGIETVVFRR